MEEIVTILSTREWAIAIWGTGFFVWMLTQREIRKSLWNVIKILLGKNLRHFFLIIALYVAGITMIFYQLPFWNNIYLKDIILWLRKNAVIYVSPYEHNAVARSIYALSKKMKFTVKELPVNDIFEIDIEKMKYEFSKDKPEAVFCTHVSNVTGYVLPIEEIFGESKKQGSINILDSAQSMGLIDIRADLIKVDIIAFAGHKTLYGPFGIGGFINVSGIKLNTFITGGTGSDSLNLDMPSGNESKYESASANIVAIAGLNAALESLDQRKCYEHEKELTKYLIERLSNNKKVKMYLPNDLENHIGIVSLTVDGFSSEDIGIILDEDFDIAVRTGYHCAPYIHKYLKDETQLGTVRVGIGQFNTKKEIDLFVKAIEEIVYE